MKNREIVKELTHVMLKKRIYSLDGVEKFVPALDFPVEATVTSWVVTMIDPVSVRVAGILCGPSTVESLLPRQ